MFRRSTILPDMALREIRTNDDTILRKTSKTVKEMTPRIKELIDDMWETLRDADGVGLAAVQVGILKRLFIIQVDDENAYTFINPEILETDGEQTGSEGCLSIPGKAGKVTRPNKVKIRALDADMKPFELEAEELLARAICHENDHLDGKLYIDIVEGDIYDVNADEGENEEAED